MLSGYNNKIIFQKLIALNAILNLKHLKIVYMKKKPLPEINLYKVQTCKTKNSNKTDVIKVKDE